MKIKRLAIDSLFLSLLIVSGLINIRLPLTDIAFTLSLLVVFIISIKCNLLDGIFIVLGYVTIGLIGIPIFTNGGGIRYIFEPSFGFILGYFFIVLVMNIGKKYYMSNLFLYILFMLASLTLVYLIGIIYVYVVKRYYLGITLDISILLKAYVLVFIPFDILKGILSYIIVKKNT